MFIYNFCKSLDNGIYDEKIKIEEKDIYIEKYNLIGKGSVKEYWINNVMILDNDNHKVFKYVEDISVEYADNYLIQEVKIDDCISFNFFKTDTEIKYELFENDVDGITYVLKVYDDFITYSYKSENKVL
jgi:hypothetical protein